MKHKLLGEDDIRGTSFAEFESTDKADSFMLKGSKCWVSRDAFSGKITTGGTKRGLIMLAGEVFEALVLRNSKRATDFRNWAETLLD